MKIIEKVKNFSSMIIGNDNTNLTYPSTLNFKYPKFRDHFLQSGELWLEGKRIDDNAENLWRVHNKLYNLSNFIDQHPGGKDWLELTKGTDITEAFESHHISKLAEAMLPRFYARDAQYPRNSPFTFKQNGFYKTLKTNAQEVLQDIPKFPEKKSKLISDCLFLSYVILALGASHFWSYTFGLFAGLFLCLNAIAAHNFFHQRDSFRMYYFDFTLMSSKAWRISHALSHHIYPNTIRDMEVSNLEPFLQYLPQEKHIFARYLSWIYSPIVYSFIYFSYWLTETIHTLVISSNYSLMQLLPFTVPFSMILITNQPILWTLLMYAYIMISSSFIFGLIGVNAAHHHPGLFHDGDTPRSTEEIDWGIYQMDCVMDRKEINGSHFLVLTNFGDHALHHLFPTIDHGRLEYLYPVFVKTCKQFGVKHRITSQVQLIKGQYFQLSKTEPNPNSPKSLTPKEN